MKSLYMILALTIFMPPAIALSSGENDSAYVQLEVAKTEIDSVKNQVPRRLRQSIELSIASAKRRIEYAQRVLRNNSVPEPVRSSYYCVVDSAFDGTFSGRGSTELEAKQNALRACHVSSRGNGIHCDDEATCQKE